MKGGGNVEESRGVEVEILKEVEMWREVDMWRCGGGCRC